MDFGAALTLSIILYVIGGETPIAGELPGTGERYRGHRGRRLPDHDVPGWEAGYRHSARSWLDPKKVREMTFVGTSKYDHLR